MTSLSLVKTNLIVGNNKKQLPAAIGCGSSRTLVVRRKPVCQIQDGLKAESMVKKVTKLGAATAAALLLNSAVADMSFAQTSAGNNKPLRSAEEILNKAKQIGNDNFAQAQKTGAETVGEAASAPPDTAQPAISQLDLKADESSESNADRIAARADYAADVAPGTSQQQGKGFNPIEKAFATPTRGIGDKQGETVARISNRDEKNKNEIPGQGTSGERPGVFNGLFNSLHDSANNRDDGKSADQNVFGTNAK